MLLLTVSLMLLYGCQHTVEDFIRIDDYEFCSLTELGKEIKKPNDVDVIANIRDSKKNKRSGDWLLRQTVTLSE